MSEPEFEFEQEVQRRGSTSLSITIPAELRKKLRLKPGDIVRVKILEVKRSKILLPPVGMEFVTPFGAMKYVGNKFVVYTITGKTEIGVEEIEKKYNELSVEPRDITRERDGVVGYIVVMIRIAEILREILKKPAGVPVEHSGATFVLHFKIKSDDIENIFRVANVLANIFYEYFIGGVGKDEIEILFSNIPEKLVKEGEVERLVIEFKGDRVNITGDRADYDIGDYIEELMEQGELVFVQLSEDGEIEMLKVYKNGEKITEYVAFVD